MSRASNRGIHWSSVSFSPRSHDVACFGSQKKGETGCFAPVKCELQKDANESEPGPFRATENFSTAPPGARHFYMLSPEPRTFNLRGNLAHVDLLAAVSCALQGYRTLVCSPLIACTPIRYACSHLSAAYG